jgi:hypothetical protein
MRDIIMMQCQKHGVAPHENFGGKHKYCCRCLDEEDAAIDARLKLLNLQRQLHPEVNVA